MEQWKQMEIRARQHAGTILGQQTANPSHVQQQTTTIQHPQPQSQQANLDYVSSSTVAPQDLNSSLSADQFLANSAPQPMSMDFQ